MENGAGNTGMCLLQLIRADTESGPFLPLIPPVTGLEGDTAGTADPKEISQTIRHHAQHIKLGEEEGMFGIMGFVFPSHHYM